MNNEKKDYRLLRPFDLEAAKRGDVICDTHGFNHYTYLGEGAGQIAVRLVEEPHYLYTCDQTVLRMAPLAWVEGKPVYKGDKPWVNGRQVVVNGFESKGGHSGKPCLTFDCSREYVDKFTWTPPKVKREGWVNVYPGNRIGMYACVSEEEAEICAAKDRIACVRIEWEE